MTIRCKDIVTEPTLHTVDVSEEVMRLPDESGLRRYAITEKRINGTGAIDVTVGADGLITRVRLVMQVGEVEAIRESR